MTYEGGGQKMSEAASAQAATAGLTALVTDNISEVKLREAQTNELLRIRPKWRKREIFSFLSHATRPGIGYRELTRCTDTRNTAE